jgi:protein required for attachment to host cells
MAAFGRTLIVVLDESRARFFRRESSGRFSDGMPEVTSGPHGSSNSHQQRAEQRTRYLQAVMSGVERACDRSECDHLVVVGPERMLGAFRRAATEKVRVRLWREAAMNVKDVTASELEKRLAGHFR